MSKANLEMLLPPHLTMRAGCIEGQTGVL